MRVHLQTKDGLQDIIIMKYGTNNLAFVNMTTREVTKSKYKTPKRALKELADLPDVRGAEIVAEDGGTREDTFEYYSGKVEEMVKRFQYDEQNDAANHALFLLSSAVGDVNGVFQKTYQGVDLDMNQLVVSAGYAMMAITMLMNAAGVDLTDVIDVNLDQMVDNE